MGLDWWNLKPRGPVDLCLREAQTHHHMLRVPPYGQSWPSSAHGQRLRTQNLQYDFRSAMRDMTLRRITATNGIIIHRGSRHRKSFFVFVESAAFRATMADEPSKKTQSATLNGEAEKSQEKPPPPLPEKPLPGDCCGSGCVRCVWDVYYEELEEYNKLYKTESGSKSEDKAN